MYHQSRSASKKSHMLETNIICIQTRLYFKQTHANAWIFSTSGDILAEPFSEINLHWQPTLVTAFNSPYYFLFLTEILTVTEREL